MSTPGLPPLTAIRAYLASTGWFPDAPGPEGALWRHPDHASPVGVPHDPDPDLVHRLLIQLAGREGRPLAELASAVWEAQPVDR